MILFEEDPQVPSADVIDHVRHVANEIGMDNPNKLLACVAAWLEREAHLAYRRAHEMMADGIPIDTAYFLAIDDMAFQLAHSAAEGWGAGKAADEQRGS